MLRAPHWALARTLLFFLCCTVTIAAFRPLVPLYLGSLDTGPLATGIVLSGFSLLPAMLSIWASSLIATLSLRWLMMVASLVLVLGCAGMGLVTQPGLVFFALLGTGLAFMVIMVVTQAQMYSIGPVEKRARNFSLLVAALSAATVVGPALGGYLARALGYQRSFFVIGGMAAVALGASQTFDHRGIQQAPAHLRWSRLRELIASPSLRLALLVTVVATTVLTLSLSFYPLHLRALGFAPEAVGTLVSLRGWGEIVGLLSMSFLEPRVGRLPLMLVAMVSAATVFALVPVFHGIGSFVLMSLVMGVSIGTLIPIGMVLITESAAPDNRLLALGLRLTLTKGVDSLGPPVYGAATYLWGPSAPFAMTSCYFAIALTYTYALRRLVVRGITP